MKFARSGGEAMTIAIRIARSFSKHKNSFSGYHGWFDWYLATNLETTKNLNEHLLEGLSPDGVDPSLRKTILPFKYDDPHDFLKTLKKSKKIGIVVVESARYNYPKSEFVKTINNICKKKNLILICDEITSGLEFRKQALIPK